MSIRFKRRIRLLAVFMMLAYIAVLAYVCFFSERYGRSIHDFHEVNLKPFKEIARFFVYREQIGFWGFAQNLFGNIVAFMPCGFMVAVLRVGRGKFIRAVLYTFLLSFCVETIQLLAGVGSFDVDDLILNTLGGILGCITFFIVNKIGRRTFGKAGL